MHDPKMKYENKNLFLFQPSKCPICSSSVNLKTSPLIGFHTQISAEKKEMEDLVSVHRSIQDTNIDLIRNVLGWQLLLLKRISFRGIMMLILIRIE